MAQIDRFMIAPINSGMTKDLKPWLIPDDAFESLTDCYVFRGRVRKRFGALPMNQSTSVEGQNETTRLRVNIGTTDASGAASGTVPGSTFAVGQMFSIGNEIFTVKATGNLLIAPISVGITDISGNASGTIPGGVGSVGMHFTIAGFTYTVTLVNGALTPGGGAPGSGTFNTLTGAYTFTGTTAQSVINLFAASGATYNTATGAYTFTAAYPSTAIYFYPATPVMGFVTYESDQLDDEPVFAFDTQFAYNYSGTGWERLATENQTGAALWHGSNSQFMWGYTYRGILSSDYFLFATNFNFPTISSSAYDYMRYWDGAAVSPAWNYLYPVLNGTYRLITARLIVPFKNRLLALNTVENAEGTNVGTTDAVTGNFTVVIGAYSYTPGQAFVVGSTIYTIISSAAGAQPMLVTTNTTLSTPPTATFNVSTGTIVITGNNNNPSTSVLYLGNPAPTTSTIKQYVNRCRFSQNGSPVNANSWLDTLGTRGGYIDAPVKEQIVSSEFLKDRLIVYFETSTWELAYTGNDVQPFRWQQINTELGAESTFSTVPFDKVVLGVGNVGVHACNGANVERVDQKIPDEVFKIHNDNQGVYRVYGIRDYYVEMVYWTFPSDVESAATFPNRILVYNYKTGSWAFNIDSITAFGYYQQQTTVQWQNQLRTWAELTNTWSSGTIQSRFRQIVAGNQQGFTFIVAPDVTNNSISLQITNVTISGVTIEINCINHNLDANNPDYILLTNVNGITGLSDMIFPVDQVIDANNFYILAKGVSGTYQGGGNIVRVSNIDIKTKQYNFYVQDGVNSFINKVDFYVDKTVNGQVVVDYSVSSSDQSLIEQGQDTTAFLGTGALETSPYALIPQENSQARLWHPIYPFAEGECIQLHIYMNAEQMTDSAIVFEDFQLHAMTFYTSPTGRLQ